MTLIHQNSASDIQKSFRYCLKYEMKRHILFRYITRVKKNK